MSEKKRHTTTLLSHDKDLSRNAKWNRDFWKNVPDEDKFLSAIELVKTAWIMKGNDPDELRLKRHIGLFKPA